MNIRFTDAQKEQLTAIATELKVDWELVEHSFVDDQKIEKFYMDTADGRKFVCIEPIIDANNDILVEDDFLHVEYFTRDEDEDTDFSHADPTETDRLRDCLAEWLSPKETTQ